MTNIPVLLVILLLVCGESYSTRAPRPTAKSLTVFQGNTLRYLRMKDGYKETVTGFAPKGSIGQVINIGDVWETKCPQGCSCEIQKFADLPLHRWAESGSISRGTNEEHIQFIQNYLEDRVTGGYTSHPSDDELLKVASCVITENPDELFAKLPWDIQVFTILESGTGESEIILRSTSLERFTDLISLDVQGLDYEFSMNKEIIDGRKKGGGIALFADALFPTGLSLLYLNLERVKLISPGGTNSTQRASLVIQPMIESIDESVRSARALRITRETRVHNQGHRLILLSSQNNGETEDKEILPYDIYKEGQSENVGLFTGLGNLAHLRLYDCSLKDLSWHMFDGLDSLVQLCLEKNDLKFIPDFCFYGTPNLKYLSLANNKLLTLKSLDLAGLLMLENLDLTGNNLTFLSELSLPPFPTLKSADFRENPLDSVFPSTFEIMNSTTKLYLGGAGANLNLQKNAFMGLRQLEWLELYNAHIAVLERYLLQGMPALLTLKIRGNITSIDFDAFVDLTNLLDLDLSFCHIRNISMDAFYGLDSIRRIDLSDNELESLPPGLFGLQQQKNLREIILSGNRLTTLPSEFFQMLRSPNRQHQQQLLSVRLDRNPWDCTCSMTTWNPQLVGRIRETAPRCATPKRLRNWGVFHALRKGGLQCKGTRKRNLRKISSRKNYGNSNNIVS